MSAPNIAAQVTNAGEWKKYVRGLLKHVKNNSRRLVDAFVAEAEVFSMLEACSSENVRVVRAAECAPVDGALVVKPMDVRDMPPRGTPYMEMLRWSQQSEGVEFLTFDVKSVEFRPINFNQHIRAGHSDISYKWADGNKYEEKAPVIVAVFAGVADELAIMPREVWQDARDYGYGVEPLVHKSPPYSQIFMVNSGNLEGTARRLLSAARREANFFNPTTRVLLDGWQPEPTRDKKVLMSVSKPLRNSVEATWKLQDKIQAEGNSRIYANMMQPLIADFILTVEGAGQAIWLEHKLRDFRHLLRFEKGLDSPWNPARLWHFCMIENAPLSQPQPGQPQFICVPRDAVQGGWHARDTFTTNEFASFACSDVRAALAFIKTRAAGAIDAARSAMGRMTDDKEEALVSSRSLAALREIQTRRENAFERAAKGPAGKGAQYFLKSLPWLSVDLTAMCRKYRQGLLFPLPDGHVMGSHVMVAHEWEEIDSGDELPRLIHDPDMSEKRCIVLRFNDCKPHMSGNPDLGWPISFARRDWQRFGVARDVLYVGSWMDSGYMESPDSRKQYWLFSSEFTTQTQQGLKRQYPAEVKAESYFKRQIQHEDLLPYPRLQLGRRPTPLKPGTHFLREEVRNMNPARYILDGAEELYLHLRDILYGTSPTVEVDSPQGFDRNRPITAARHHTRLCDVLQASWDFGLLRRPDRDPNKSDFEDMV